MKMIYFSPNLVIALFTLEIFVLEIILNLIVGFYNNYCELSSADIATHTYESYNNLRESAVI